MCGGSRARAVKGWGLNVIRNETILETDSRLLAPAPRSAVLATGA